MLKLNDNKIDMLNGSLVDKLIIFALPIAVTNILQLLFNAADIIVCGRFVGSVALAAVGANSQIINLFLNSFIGLSIGANVMIANYIGAGKKEKIHNVVQTAMTFAISFGLVILIIGQVFARKFLLFLGTPDDVIEKATLYLRIYFLGIPFVVIYNFGASILRAIGDTRRPLIILAITGVLNVILNIVLVIFFNLGVEGVAIATTISNAISSIVVVLLLTKEKSEVHYNIKEIMFNVDSFSKIMRIGIPSAIQGMVFSLSNLCIQSAINSLGTKTIAANVAALNFEMFPYFVYTSFSAACLTFMSQNFGAKNYDRCKDVFKKCVIIGAIVSIIFELIIWLNAHALLSIFTNDPEVVDIAIVRMNVVGTVCWIQVLYDCCAAALRALKHPFVSTVSVIICTVLFRIVWIITAFPLFNTYFAIVIAYPISWIMLNIIMFSCYLHISKKMLNA